MPDDPKPKTYRVELLTTLIPAGAGKNHAHLKFGLWREGEQGAMHQADLRWNNLPDHGAATFRAQTAKAVEGLTPNRSHGDGSKVYETLEEGQVVNIQGPLADLIVEMHGHGVARAIARGQEKHLAKVSAERIQAAKAKQGAPATPPS